MRGRWPPCPPPLCPDGAREQPVALDGTAVLESHPGIAPSPLQGALEGRRLYQAALRGPQPPQNNRSYSQALASRQVIYGGLSCGHLCVCDVDSPSGPSCVPGPHSPHLLRDGKPSPHHPALRAAGSELPGQPHAPVLLQTRNQSFKEAVRSPRPPWGPQALVSGR